MGKPKEYSSPNPLSRISALRVGVSHDPVIRNQHREEERQFIDGRDFALDEDRAFIGIDPDGEIIRGDIDDALADFVGPSARVVNACLLAMMK